MTKIVDLNDFNKVTSSITSFSHAYLLSVNSLDSAFIYAKELAKSIILEERFAKFFPKVPSSENAEFFFILN